MTLNQTAEAEARRDVSYASIETLTCLVNRTITWVIYPRVVSRARMTEFIKLYYVLHPERFRAYETLEFTRFDILGMDRFNPETEPMRERELTRERARPQPDPHDFDENSPESPDRVRVPKLSKTDAHGTREGYKAGCRCRACRMGVLA